MLVGQKLVADDSILDADARVHLADGGDLARRRRHAQQIVKDDAALDVVDLPERRRHADAIAFERTVAGDALRCPADLPAALYCTAHIGDHAQRPGRNLLGLEVVADTEARPREYGLAPSLPQLRADASQSHPPHVLRSA